MALGWAPLFLVIRERLQGRSEGLWGALPDAWSWWKPQVSPGQIPKVSLRLPNNGPQLGFCRMLWVLWQAPITIWFQLEGNEAWGVAFPLGQTMRPLLQGSFGSRSLSFIFHFLYNSLTVVMRWRNPPTLFTDFSVCQHASGFLANSGLCLILPASPNSACET